ncbi:putative NT-type C2 domain-containing protein [Helianthus anomalus]
MVLGLKTKSRKNPYVQLDYIFNLIEIKPWPPSQSLRSLRSAFLQWEHGDKNSGSTKPVAPLISGSGVGDGKIEFNETFKVHVTLTRDPSVKTGDDETFLTNCIVFNMYEPRRDRVVKGQLLATAVIDFAEYSIVEGSLMISVPMNCKRTFGNTAQPMLFVKIQTVERNNHARSSSRESLVREGSMDTNQSESVSALMNEEYAEEAESASVTDDDISSQSSLATGSSTFGSNGISSSQKENGYEAICRTTEKVNGKKVSVQDKRAAYEKNILSSKDLYTEVENARATLSNIRNSRFIMLPRKAVADDGTTEQCIQSKILDASQNGQESQSQTIGDFRFDADRLRNVNSVGSSLDSCLNNGSVRASKVIERFKNVGVHDRDNEMKDMISKVQQLEQRVQVLEGELTEAAAIEFSIYSVVAEHGSSIRKVHASARRLSRLYFHACKESSLRRSNSAKSIVSGLILVAKACGNDVARLTFWLSNSVMLRAIIHKSIEKDTCLNGSRSDLHTTSNESDDTRVIISDLEKVESWMFSRIVESIWWQTLAPYMQSTTANGIVIDCGSSKSCETTTSFELWKTAFKDVCERICPVRAAGHNCGCLSVLSMLIMEQCVSRLDVAMFNAILRESGDEVPTDPVSDPISDSSVLPIPSGKASVGAGALLKRTIGNWSSWLTDLFGTPITFHLLTALSELMMLPKDMLLSNTIRSEVCPTFGVPLIKRIVDNFTPDEFCPDPLPEVVLEALDSEDLLESGEDCVMSLPCVAAPIVYHPPSASLIGCILGDDGSPARLSRSGSSILRKSNTSDDELDELESPLTSIVDSSQAVAASVKPVWSLKNVDGCSNDRYRLLRDVWMNSD